MAINEMDARLISQGTQVESVGAEALIPVASGEGQPQSNITLANLADSLGKAVPQQQDAEQVVMTGLYAQTSDGKMVELTKESVASVMAGLMGKKTVLYSDMNDYIETGFYFIKGVTSNLPNGATEWYGSLNVFVSQYPTQMLSSIQDNKGTWIRIADVSGEAIAWKPWQRIDNFGANTKEELASMVAGLLSKGTQANYNIDTINEFGWLRVQGTTAISESELPYPGNWFFLVNIPVNNTYAIQFAVERYGSEIKIRTKWDGVYSSWTIV